MLAEQYNELPKDTFARRNEDGLIEVVSKTTGEVLAVQRSHLDFLKTRENDFSRHRLEDGTEVFVEKGLSLDKIRRIGKWRFSWTIAHLIAQRIAEGESLTGICKDPNFPPYSTLCLWRKDNADFNELLNQAVIDGAQHAFDQMMSLIETIVDDDSAKIAMAKANLLRWIAERANPDKFASKKSEVKFAAAVNLIIDTGVPPPNDNKLMQRDVTPALEGGLNGTQEKEAQKAQEVILKAPDIEVK